MRTSFLNIIGAGAGIILASATLVCGQPVLYQSTTVDTGTNLNFANNQEIGQEIWLGTGVTPVWLTNLSFEYYSPVQAFNGNVKMDVIIYANSGPKFNGYKSPGIVLYNSGLIPLLTPYFVDGTSVATFNITRSDLLNGIGTGSQTMLPTQILPQYLTISVTFSGFGTGDSAGLENFGSPTVGGNYGDYWFNTGSGWEILTNGTPTSFGMQLMGATPEPTVLAMSALGTVMIAGFIRRRRK